MLTLDVIWCRKVNRHINDKNTEGCNEKKTTELRKKMNKRFNNDNQNYRLYKGHRLQYLHFRICY